MKTIPSRSLQSIALAFALTLSHAMADSVITNENLPYRTSFELGSSAFAPGDSITIKKLRGTSKKVEVGGTYSVEGTYTLNSKDEATLAFFDTSVGYSGPTPVDPKQRIRIKKGSGSFYLVKTMDDDGYLHVSFYRGESFGGVYFGQGNRVYHEPLSLDSHSDSTGDNSGNTAHEPLSYSGPNQALFNYLGNPVMPPANMDQRYTANGLTSAIQQAARNAGIAVKSVAVDDSEYPLLVCVVCGGSDAAKLKAALKSMPGYQYGGGVGNDSNNDGSDTCNAFCIVPHSAFPQGTADQIYHRLMLREAVFYDQVSNRK
ncbi:MAG TPA: hypothetical protein VNV43_15135 [Candidatus Acidoferrales bacterium]|nr:hypothetical protein [Candidatus Acidoferrales bacterium]